MTRSISTATVRWSPRASRAPQHGLDRHQPELLEAGGIGLQGRLIREVLERLAPPQRKRCLQLSDGGGWVVVEPSAGFAHAGFEVERVEPVPVDADRVAARVALDDLAERLAKLRHVRLQRVACACRAATPPTHRRSAGRSTPSCWVRRGAGRGRAAASDRPEPSRGATGSRPRRPAPAPRPAGGRAPRIARRHRRNRGLPPPPSHDGMADRVVGARSKPLEERSETSRSRPAGPAGQGICVSDVAPAAVRAVWSKVITALVERARPTRGAHDDHLTHDVPPEAVEPDRPDRRHRRRRRGPRGHRRLRG